MIAHLSEIAEAAHRSDPEFINAIFADAWALDAEFEQVYGLSLRVAEQNMSLVHGFSEHYREHMEGEEVMTALPIRLLHRLGYVDGLHGWVPHAPDGPKPWSLEEEVDETPEESLRQIGVISRIQDLFLPAYDLGHAFGSAERYLREHAPALVDAIDRVALQALASEQEGVELLGTLYETLNQVVGEINAYEYQDPEEILLHVGTYKKERAFRVLAMRARAAILARHVRGAGTPHALVCPLRVASTVRDLSHQLQNLADSVDPLDAMALGNRTRRWIESQLSEAIVLLGAHGVTPQQMYRLRAGEEAVEQILLAGAEDGESDRERTLVRGVAARLLKELSRPVGNYWAPPAHTGLVWVDASATDRFSPVLAGGSGSGWTAVEAVLKRFSRQMQGLAQPTSDPVEASMIDRVREMRTLAEVEASERGKDSWEASARVAGRKLAELTEFEAGAEDRCRLILDLEVEIARREAAMEDSLYGSEERWWDVFEVAYLTEVAALLADHFLGDMDRGGLDAHLAAELDRASHAEAQGMEQALRTAELERREAHQALADLSDPDHSRKAARHFARARAIEDAVLDGMREELFPLLGRAMEEATGDREALFDPEVWDEVAFTMDETLGALLEERAEVLASHPRYALRFLGEMGTLEFQLVEAERAALAEVARLDALGLRYGAVLGGDD